MTAQLFRFGQTPAELAGVDRQLDALTGFVSDLAASAGPRRRPDRRAAARSEDGDRLSHEEFVSFVVLLFMNGLETVTTAVANCVAALLWRPGLVAELRPAGAGRGGVRRVPADWTAAVAGSRRASSEIPGGTSDRPNQPVFLLWRVANRDPRVFAAPDEFGPAAPAAPVLRQGPAPLPRRGAGRVAGRDRAAPAASAATWPAS